MNYNLLAYLIYGIISLFTIGVVGRYLHKNGRPFVLRALLEKNVTDYTNNSFLAGYYLVNMGYVLLTLREWEVIFSLAQLTEMIAFRTGGIYLLLGILHAFNITALAIYANYKKINLFKN